MCSILDWTIVTLYNQYVRPGAMYIYFIVYRDTETRTADVRVALRFETIAIVIMAVLFAVLIWLPYLHGKKKEVPSFSVHLG